MQDLLLCVLNLAVCKCCCVQAKHREAILAEEFTIQIDGRTVISLEQ